MAGRSRSGGRCEPCAGRPWVLPAVLSPTSPDVSPRPAPAPCVSLALLVPWGLSSPLLHLDPGWREQELTRGDSRLDVTEAKLFLLDMNRSLRAASTFEVAAGQSRCSPAPRSPAARRGLCPCVAVVVPARMCGQTTSTPAANRRPLCAPGRSLLFPVLRFCRGKGFGVPLQHASSALPVLGSRFLMRGRPGTLGQSLSSAVPRPPLASRPSAAPA